jgi:hypothetical protein
VLAAVERLHLLEDFDEGGGVVAAGLDVEAQAAPALGAVEW